MPTPSPKGAQTEKMREAALRALRSHGKDFSRIHNHKLLYELADHRTFLLRTNRKRILILKADDPGVDAKLDLEAAELVIFCCPRDHHYEVYMIPTSVVGRDARAERVEWYKTAKTKGANMTWQMVFDNDVGRVCYGYAEKYKQYRLGEPSFIASE